MIKRAFRCKTRKQIFSGHGTMTRSPRAQNDRVLYEMPHDDDPAEKPNLDGDRLNFWLLIVLYVIQGFPIGLSAAIPILLQSKYSADFNDQVSFRHPPEYYSPFFLFLKSATRPPAGYAVKHDSGRTRPSLGRAHKRTFSTIDKTKKKNKQHEYRLRGFY